MTAILEEQTTLERLQTMIVQGVNRLPVVDQAGRSLGVLTRDDVLGAVAGGNIDRQRQQQAREACA